MMHLTPQIIAGITGGEYIGDGLGRDARITGAVRDNREAKHGNLFVCIRGARVDGHSFANAAFDSGAVCCLAEQRIPNAKGPYVLVGSTLEAIKAIGGYYRSLFKRPVVGVTGSVGKTTAKELIAAALGTKLRVHKTTDNLNNELGVPLTLLSLDERHDVGVIEMGISTFGEMGRLAEMVRPDILVITRIGYSHLEDLGDLNGVLRAKTEVFAYMASDGIAVMNGDDELLRDFDSGMRKLTFGLEKHNDIRAENIRAEGTDFVMCDVVSDVGRFPVKIPAYGSHIAQLALPGVIIGRLLGLTDAEIGRGLLGYAPVGGRSNVAGAGFITLIDDCYNANPNSVEAALTSLSALDGRRVAILGDMLGLGAQTDKLHEDVGAFAARGYVDALVCCGDKACLIYDGYIAAGGKEARYFPEKAGLIEALPRLIKKGDAVLVKASRGMEFEEFIPVLQNMGG